MSTSGRLVLYVPPEGAGMRLDRFLATVESVRSRAQAKQLIDAGRVRVDDQRRKGGYLVRGGGCIEIDLPPPPPVGIEAEALPVTVLFEDADLLAVDKPAGMVVHPAPGARRGTLVNALLHRLGDLGEVGAAERPGIVHRLDRETSGVLLVARHAAALEALARQFRERTVEKTYLAVVRGRLEPAAGTTDRPIGRHARDRKRMSVRSRRGRAATTRWRVVERLGGASVVRLMPETGRTHQLRVHLAALGHPILGDPVYGAGGGRVRLAGVALARQALHAEAIRFTHPRSGERVLVRAPLPPDLEELLSLLRQVGGAVGKSGRSA